MYKIFILNVESCDCNRKHIFYQRNAKKYLKNIICQDYNIVNRHRKPTHLGPVREGHIREHQEFLILLLLLNLLSQ